MTLMGYAGPHEIVIAHCGLEGFNPKENPSKFSLARARCKPGVYREKQLGQQTMSHQLGPFLDLFLHTSKIMKIAHSP